MANESFKAISLEVHGIGKYRQVRCVLDAACCLLEHWPIPAIHT
jgi:hypothetical protein